MSTEPDVTGKDVQKSNQVIAQDDTHLSDKKEVPEPVKQENTNMLFVVDI